MLPRRTLATCTARCRLSTSSRPGVLAVAMRPSPTSATILHQRRHLSTKEIIGAVKNQIRNMTSTGEQPVGLYEALPRYPNASTMGVLRGLDYMGTVSFAVSGSVTAATCGLDLVGCTVVGTITALGGGTIRDVIFGKLPVFWLDEQEYVYMAAAAAFTTFVLCCFIELDSFKAYEVVMFWTDTIGLGAFAVIGTMYAIRLRYPTFLILLCTLVTCTGGGMIRDTLCRRPVRVLYPHQDTYAITTIAGGAVWIATRAMGVSLAARMPLAAGTVIGLRCLAASTGFHLPAADLLLKRQHRDAPELDPAPIKGGERATSLKADFRGAHFSIEHLRTSGAEPPKAAHAGVVQAASVDEAK
jgi:uncharacterized membrane protein YeiH